MPIFADANLRQYQRKANWWEGLLSAVQVPNNIMAGAADSILHGENPLEGAARFVKGHGTFQDTLENVGVAAGPMATLGGLAADFAFDPTSYLGIGEITHAGQAARAARMGMETALMAKDARKVAESTAEVARTGIFSNKLSEQALAGHRDLITFLGKPLLPNTYGAKVYDIGERASQFMGKTGFGKAVGKVFNTAQNLVPESVKLRNIQRVAAIRHTVLQESQDLGLHGGQYYDAMKALGVDPAHARDILADSVELMRADEKGLKLIDFMDEATRQKYFRWTMQAHGNKFGQPNNIGVGLANEAGRMHMDVGSQLPRPNIGWETPHTETSTFRADLGAEEAKAGLRGGRRTRRRAGGGPDVSVRGNQRLVGGDPNLLLAPDAWDFHGRMPEEFIKTLPENTRKAIRRAEDTAIEQATALHINRTIKEVVGKYGVQWTKDLHPVIRKAVNYINASNAAYLSAERLTGLKVGELAGALNYLKRAVTPQARQIIAERMGWNGGGSGYDFAVRFSSQLQRDEHLRELTLTEVNRLAMDGKLTHLLGDKKMKLFDDEPFHATFIRGTESARAVEAARMVKDASYAFGKEVGDGINAIDLATIPSGHRLLQTRLAEDLGLRVMKGDRIVKDVAMPDDIANLLENQYERVITPHYLQPVLETWDTVTRMWKNLTLPIWPAYQTRNAFSDFMLITGHGDEFALSPFEAAGAIKDAAYGLAGKSTHIDGVEWNKFKELLDKHGIIDYSPGRDLDENIIRPTGLPRYGSKLQNANEWLEHAGWGQLRPIEAGLRVSVFRQNSTNAGYFLGLLRKGVSPEIAALEVKKRLFDFGDLTDVERQVLRRVFPFYSWLRHNLPYQIKNALQRPGSLASINRMREAASGGRGPAGDVPLPGFLREGMPIMMPFGTEANPQFARMMSLVPQGDLANLGMMGDMVLNNVSPLIKAPAEMTYNYDLFQNQPLERYPWDMTTRVGVPVAKRWTPMIDMVRPITEANNLMKPGDPRAKAMNLMMARSYGVDKALELRLMNYKLERAVADAKKQLKAAAAKGDTRNVVSIRNYIRHLYENPSELLK